MCYLRAVSVFSLLIILSLMLSCGDKSTGPPDDLTIQIISSTECKQFDPIDTTAEGKSAYTPSNLDCIEFQYRDNKLTLVHLNAGFNCCTDFVIDLSISGDTIIISESEEGAYCRCLCLYDLYYEISNLPRGNYIIKVIELYIDANDQILMGELNLNENPGGAICIVRKNYPWNIGNMAAGRVTNHSACGGFTAKTADVIVPEDSACVIYEYSDSTGILNIRHQNTIFNCCVDSLTGETEIYGLDIYINEKEYLMNGGCDCICSYDIDFELTGITPGIYTLNVITWIDTTKIYMDLIREPSGYYCYDLIPWALE